MNAKPKREKATETELFLFWWANWGQQHFAVGEIMPLTLTLNIPAEDRKTKVEVRFIEENVQQLKGKVSYNNMVLKQLEC